MAWTLFIQTIYICGDGNACVRGTHDSDDYEVKQTSPHHSAKKYNSPKIKECDIEIQTLIRILTVEYSFYLIFKYFIFNSSTEYFQHFRFSEYFIFQHENKIFSLNISFLGPYSCLGHNFYFIHNEMLKTFFGNFWRSTSLFCGNIIILVNNLFFPRHISVNDFGKIVQK